jgi:thiamine-phosphate pyrophosphorylase
MIGPLYVVTEAGAPRPAVEQALAAARGGAWAVQLRDKTATDAALTSLAREVMAAIAPFGTRLFVNDRVAVARAAGAHGLHIGQTDGDPRAARALVGPDVMLGLSVESLADASAIPPGLVDYVGAGPVRATPSKPDHAPPIGMDGLAAIARAAPCPAIAIGGLGPGDAAALHAAGAAGMAVVSAVTRAPDMEAAARALLDEWSDA